MAFFFKIIRSIQIKSGFIYEIKIVSRVEFFSHRIYDEVSVFAFLLKKLKFIQHFNEDTSVIYKILRMFTNKMFNNNPCCKYIYRLKPLNNIQ